LRVRAIPTYRVYRLYDRVYRLYDVLMIIHFFQIASLLPECAGICTIWGHCSWHCHSLNHAATWMVPQKIPPPVSTGPYSQYTVWPPRWNWWRYDL